MTTWMDKGIRDEVDCAQFAKAQAVPAMGETQGAKLAAMFPDWRDIRIIELEAALRGALDAGRGLSAVCTEHERRAIAYEARIAELDLMLSPERDMSITHEELDA